MCVFHLKRYPLQYSHMKWVVLIKFSLLKWLFPPAKTRTKFKQHCDDNIYLMFLLKDAYLKLQLRTWLTCDSIPFKYITSQKNTLFSLQTSGAHQRQIVSKYRSFFHPACQASWLTYGPVTRTCLSKLTRKKTVGGDFLFVTYEANIWAGWSGFWG